MTWGPEPERSRPDRSHRIGIFGGTFDPPHVGHTRVAADVADFLGLERVLWIPAGEPPHKPSGRVSPAAVRLEMVRAAVRADRRFEACTLEYDRPGPSFTVDTLETLRRAMPEADLVLIVGADQFADLGAWRDPERIVALATLAVMDRDGASARMAPPELAGAERARTVPVRRVDVSSTRIRQLVREGRDVSGLVPPGVLDIIEREGLYR